MTSIERRSGGCSDFVSNVAQHFQYLFEDYGFLTTYQEDPGSFDNCLVVLESEKCRIRLARDRGAVHAQVGPLSAPDVWTRDGHHLWFFLGTVIAFLTRETDAMEQTVCSTDNFATGSVGSNQIITETGQQLADLAGRLHPYCAKVIELFREDRFRQVQPQLEAFKRQQRGVSTGPTSQHAERLAVEGDLPD